MMIDQSKAEVKAIRASHWTVNCRDSQKASTGPAHQTFNYNAE
jgi:hypothetical protein